MAEHEYTDPDIHIELNAYGEEVREVEDLDVCNPEEWDD